MSKSEESRSQEIGIEIFVNRKQTIAGKEQTIANQNVLFHPLKKILRGRWDRSLLPGGTSASLHDEKLMEIQVMPGIRIGLNPTTGAARVFDPLGEKEYAAIRKTVDDVYATVFGGRHEPEPTQTFRLSKDQVATWYYWMKRLVDEGSAILWPESTWLPKAPEGRVKVNSHDSGQTAKRYLDQFPKNESEPDYVAA